MDTKWAKTPLEVNAARMLPEGEVADDSGGDTKVGRAMLTVHFVQSNGDMESFSYAHLYAMKLEGNERIRLTFSDHVVVIEGRGLDKLYRKLGDHHKAKVTVTDRPEFAKGEVVESITVTEKQAQR